MNCPEIRAAILPAAFAAAAMQKGCTFSGTAF